MAIALSGFQARFKTAQKLKIAQTGKERKQMLNKCQLIGNLGRDPESRMTSSGMTVVNFSVATTETVKTEKVTTWHKIVVFGKLADICAQYLTKGKMVYIEGRIQNREWEDKDGNKKSTTEIVASEMRMLGGREGGSGVDKTSTTAKAKPTSNEPPPYDDDSIPF